jgi:MFS family permease
MAFEVSTARFSSIYYGSTIKIWSILLIITLLSLAIGYKFGGKLSNYNEKTKINTLIILLLATAFMYFFPYFAYEIGNKLVKIDSIFGILICFLLLVSPPIICFGALTPILIQIMCEGDVINAGKYSGIIYSVSTFGGVFGTFIFGLYFLPYWGLNFSIQLIAYSLLIFALFFLLLKNKTVNLTD